MSTENLFANIEEVAVLEDTNFESMLPVFIILEILFTRFVEYRSRQTAQMKNNTEEGQGHRR